MKKLSIITICWNEPNLERTCESIIHQTWQDFEWVVIDGGSDAKTQAIWDKYKYRIDKFVSEKDNGLYNAMNKGIKLASGEYLNFMNAGDFFYDSDVLKDLFENKEYTDDVLYGDYSTFSQEQNKWTINKVVPKISTYRDIMTFNHQATFIKRELFDQYGLYDEQFKIVADYDGFLRFYTDNRIFSHVDRVVACFDTTGISSTAIGLKNKEFDIVNKKYFPDEA